MATKLTRWWRRVQRRRPGIYAYRTRRHRNPRRREWGYVGKSVHLVMRDQDHAGLGKWGQEQKPWYDLVVKRYTLELPWWLGWNWVISILEALAIWALRPRYNTQLNPRRSKVRPVQQKAQRLERDRGGAVYLAKVRSARITDVVIRVIGVLVVVAGLTGWWFTR